MGERQEQIELAIAREEAVRLARRALEVTTLLGANQKRMTELIQQSPPPRCWRWWALAPFQSLPS